MRIDKFMKVSRLIKRRTVANEVADAGRITVNGKPVKASYAVKEGDVIEVAFGQRPVRVKVVSTEAPTGKEDRKSTRLNSSHLKLSRMPSSA